MNTALDYDGTYTRDPLLWNAVIKLMRSRGHRVYVVTMRYPNEEALEVKSYLLDHVDEIIFTGRRAKKPTVDRLGISIDVWIDDQPHFIQEDAL